jgi:hypothetical protein
VIKSESGTGSARIQARIDALLESIRPRIPRRFIASDGDTTYHIYHGKFLDFWVKAYKRFGLDSTPTDLKQDPGALPLSDILHLSKNGRVHFLTYELTFSDSHVSTSIDHVRVHEILGFGPALTDLSPIGKMRDAYPLVMMGIRNLVALIDHGAIAETISLLPLCLSLHAIRLETIARETRTDLLRINFFLVWRLYQLKRDKMDKNPEKSAKGGKRTIFSSQWAVRFLNAILLLIFSLNHYQQFSLDRLGTHPLENFFGFMRWDANNINTADEMITTITHMDIVKKADQALEI